MGRGDDEVLSHMKAGRKGRKYLLDPRKRYSETVGGQGRGTSKSEELKMMLGLKF
jgi:hypothetical protein